MAPEQRIPRFRSGTGSLSGPERQQGEPERWVAPIEEKGSSDEQFDLHAKEFLHLRQDAAAPHRGRGRRPPHSNNLSPGQHRAPVEAADRVGSRKEEIAGDREASSYLERPYRAPWDKMLRSLLA